MKNFMKIAQGIDVMPLALEIQRQPELWDVDNERLGKDKPHYQTHDIWLRYKDKTENVKSGDWSNFGAPHESVWYPAFYALPSAKRLIFELMARVEGERLGGVLIYKVPPGREILPHVDPGWHAENYDKFNFSIQSQPGCSFYYPKDEESMHSNTGDVYWFRNTVVHGVKNASDADQIIMCVCIQTHKFKGA